MNISFRVIIPAHYVFLHKMLGIKPKFVKANFTKSKSWDVGKLDTYTKLSNYTAKISSKEKFHVKT